MHNNYYFLRQLSLVLESKLHGAVVSECHSQHKDELIIRFETHGKPFFVKASLQPEFCCLSFPEIHNRARKNSIDLFQPLIGQRLQSVRQFNNERSFALQFSNDWLLLFKMHGNKANLILYKNNQVHDLFKKNRKADYSLQLITLDRVIDWSYQNFEANHLKLQNIYYTFGKLIWRYLEEMQFNQLPIEEKWEIIQNIKQQLEQPHYYIVMIDKGPHLSLIPLQPIIKQFEDPIESINAFFPLHSQARTFNHDKDAALAKLQSKLEGSKNYYTKNIEKLKELENNKHYTVWANLIMANLHLITTGESKVVLPNLYNNNEPIEIKLKKELSPQNNAALYYRKAKNQAIEISHLQQNLKNKEAEISQLTSLIQQIHSVSSIPELQQLVSPSNSDYKKGKAVTLPYYEFEHRGYKIWVGKNAAANDELTLRYAYKEDLWLHAKDVAGSHVIVKYQSGKNFPSDVIERAAALAAYNSKRKNESLCPVIVTTKKFVRKKKGSPPGKVVVEKEEVIMVEPNMS